jgi:hypothetical protein
MPRQGTEREGEARAVAGTVAADGGDGWASADGGGGCAAGSNPSRHGQGTGRACGGKCDSGCQPIPIRVWSTAYICSGSFL